MKHAAGPLGSLLVRLGALVSCSLSSRAERPRSPIRSHPLVAGSAQGLCRDRFGGLGVVTGPTMHRTLLAAPPECILCNAGIYVRCVRTRVHTRREVRSGSASISSSRGGTQRYGQLFGRSTGRRPKETHELPHARAMLATDMTASGKTGKAPDRS